MKEIVKVLLEKETLDEKEVSEIMEKVQQERKERDIPADQRIMNEINVVDSIASGINETENT
jgi:hypothetical protein